MWWLYILCFLFGGFCGMTIMCLMVAAKNRDSYYEDKL